MYYGKAELEVILAKADGKEFTHYLYGKPKRYVVGLTHNVRWSHDLLEEQIRLLRKDFETLTIGGRQDQEWSSFLVDVGTAVDDLEQAKTLGRKFNQACIRDSLIGVNVNL